VSQTQQLTAALKRCLKAKGVTYADLAPELGLSEASVKRIFSKGDLSLERLETVCRRVEVDFYDLARMARSSEAAPNALTAEQEQALARDPRLLTLLHLLLNDWTFREILAEYALSEAELVRLLARLDRLRVIELQPGNRVRLRCPKNLAWRPGGAVWATHERRVVDEFFNADFDDARAHRGDARAHRRFEVRELAPASLAVLRRKLDKLAAEFNELAEMDSVLRPAERVSVGLVAACRPWVFSVSHALKRRAAVGGKEVQGSARPAPARRP
jgi:DNA-binding Xre family transcriptional regulator